MLTKTTSDPTDFQGLAAFVSSVQTLPAGRCGAPPFFFPQPLKGNHAKRHRPTQRRRAIEPRSKPRARPRRVYTPANLAANIVSEHYFTAADAIGSARRHAAR